MTEENNNLQPETNQNTSENIAPIEDNNQETISLSSEPQNLEASENVEASTNVNAGEVPPIQTDLNQNPPIEPKPNNPFPTQDVTASGFEEKKEQPNKIKKPLIIVGCLLVLALLGYFVIYPMVADIFMSSPKNVFEATIEKLTTNVSKSLDTVNLGNSSYDLDFKLDTNVEDLKSFADVDYKFKAGMDSKNQRLEAKATMIKKDKSEVGATMYVRDNYLFYKLSSDERIIKAMDLSQDEDFKKIFEQDESVNSEDIKYLINKVKELAFKDLKEEDFVKEDTNITVNGSEVKATKNSLVINKEKLTVIYKSIFNGLYEDKKAMDIINEMGLTKEDFKKEFVDIKYDDIDDDLKLTINVYSNKKDVIGFDFYDKEERLVYYYSNEGNFEAAMNESDADNKISITGVKDGDITNVSCKIGKEEYLVLKVSTFTEEEIKFDYTFKIDENQKMTGTVDIKQSNNVVDANVSAKVGEEYIKSVAKLTIEQNAKIAEFDANSAVSISEEEQQKMLNNFLSTTKGTPLEFYSETLSENQNKASYYMYDGNTINQTQQGNNF